MARENLYFLQMFILMTSYRENSVCINRAKPFWHLKSFLTFSEVFSMLKATEPIFLKHWTAQSPHKLGMQEWDDYC